MVDMVEGKIMNIFVSMSTDLYFSELEKVYRKVVENSFPLVGAGGANTIVVPSDYMEQIDKATKDMSRKDRERYVTGFFLKKVEQCDVFIYVNTVTKDGNVLFTKGVRGEIGRAIELGKIVYRLYLNENDIKLQKMDISYFDTVVKSYDYNVREKEWKLKSVSDYIRFYQNNPEAAKLICEQFAGDGLGKYIAVPHFNYVSEIEKYGDGKYRGCKKHGDRRHAIILPKQEFTKECPYTEDRWIWADYSTVSLKEFPSDGRKIIDLLGRTRTLHKLMFILDKNRKSEKSDNGKCDYSKEGLAYVNEDGKIPFERGKPVKDWGKIVGVCPLFDIDIKDEYKKKKTDSFFEDSIFSEFQKTIDLFFKYYDLDGKERGIFSGNGLYIDLGEKTFEDVDCNGFYEFDSEWLSIRKTMQEIMNDNGIKRLQIEKGYGWNRYFKVAGTFHARSERISIPINLEESLDRKWLNDITNIGVGLEQNVFNEILNRSGNNWK